MLQEQKKTYEEKMEEYEALQLQKKVWKTGLLLPVPLPCLSHCLHHSLTPCQDYEEKLSELESALVKEMQSERSASEEKLELQRKVHNH